MMKKGNKEQFKIRKGPDGLHIFDRKSGLNILMDEYTFNSDKWTICPRQVSIALTNRCNLQCSHCYAPKDIRHLKKEDIKQWIKELDISGCFGIGFGGGEPTLYPDLVEICEFAQKETKLAVSMTTNATQFTSSLINQLRRNINFIRISMDGVNRVYEEMRGHSFPDFLSRLELLSSNIGFGINYLVNSRTIGDIDKVFQIAKDYGAAEILFLPEEPVGLGNKVDKTTLGILKEWIKAYTGDIRLSLSESYKYLVNSDIGLELEPEYLSFSHIDATGKLRLNSFTDIGYHIEADGVLAAFKKLLETMEEK